MLGDLQYINPVTYLQNPRNEPPPPLLPAFPNRQQNNPPQLRTRSKHKGPGARSGPAGGAMPAPLALPAAPPWAAPGPTAAPKGARKGEGDKAERIPHPRRGVPPSRIPALSGTDRAPHEISKTILAPPLPPPQKKSPPLRARRDRLSAALRRDQPARAAFCCLHTGG